MRLFGMAIFTVLLTASLTAQAEKISGKVIVKGEFRESLAEAEKKEAEAKKSYYWNEPNGITDVRPPMVNPGKDLAVVITRVGAKPPKPDDVKTVLVHAGSLEKNVIVTRPGSTLKFKNVDPYDHSLFSPTMASFKPELQVNGAVRTVEFAEEGIFEINCKLVPHLRAFVVVTKATHVVPLNGDGTFSLGDLEAGKYQLKVFHGGKWVHSDSCEVGGAKNREAKMNITLKPGVEEAKETAKSKKKESGAS